MSIASYLAFCGLCVLLALTPGPDTFLILRFSMRRAAIGVAAAFGSALGSLMWAVLVGIGLAALIEQSVEAYRVVKVLGGLYLVYLGIQALRHARVPAAEPGIPVALRRTLLPALAAGLLSTMTNPKVGLFFLAVVPQFLPHGANAFVLTMALGATDGIIALVYLACLAKVAAKANEWLKRPKVTVGLERTSGGILAALGVGVLASSATE
ncbi:LysE family translocator [Parafrigoribacterium mesophilum]|uniref:LysE family translocator n=1 Tax=Parafrigoribacterium mesophilum TaxID=433646 RepID=UPI0031FC7F98